VQKTDTLPQDVVDLAGELGIGERIYAVMDVTREMFPGPVSAETGYDPSWPDDRWITFNVEATGTFKEIIDRELEWHRRVAPLISPRLDAVGLLTMPR